MTQATTTSGQSTPIHDRYSSTLATDTSTAHTPNPVPRLPTTSNFPSVHSSITAPATQTTSPGKGMDVHSMPSTPQTSTAPIPPRPRSPLAHPSVDPAEPALEDGPLFRAHLASLERRAHSLRSTLKKLARAIEESNSTLRDQLSVNSTVDEALEDLGGGGLAGGGDPLGEVYDRVVRKSRERRKLGLERDIERGKELGERLKGGIERLKLVEERKKAFESESKRFYEELAKYLAKPEPDASKIASSDSKQSERTEGFLRHRIDYFSFVEGIVASEEHAVAEWLKVWENVEDSTAQETGNNSHEGWVHLDEHNSSAHSAALFDALHLAAEPESSSCTPSASNSTGAPRRTPSRSSTLELPPPTSPAHSHETPQESKRKRRTSLPHWGLSPSPSMGAEREGHSKRSDRLKGFIKSSLTTAQNSIQSALPSSSSSHNLFSPTSESFPRSPPLGSLPRTPPVTSDPSFPPVPPLASASTANLTVPSTASATPSRSVSASSSHPRKKEGFLYATESGQRHSTAGDGGAKYNRYWVVLSEGQLVEYDRWTDSLSVHGTPINLRYATARISRQGGERRFCFEVLTPQLRRVYQATSEKECLEWITAISKSVESLLNGTSSVRHFDASKMNNFDPLSSDYTSSLAQATEGGPVSPRGGRFGPFLSRHTSLGHSRKTSGSSKKDNRRSIQQPPSVPSFRIGEEEPQHPFFDSGSRRGVFALSEGSDGPSMPSRPMLDGLGIPFPGSYGSRANGTSLSPSTSLLPASRSSPNLLIPRSRTNTTPSDGSITGDDDDASSIISAQDRAISDAVKGWAASAASGSTGSGSGGASRLDSQLSNHSDTKYRNALRIVEIAEDRKLGNGVCVDCRDLEPKWASWSLGIVLCIRCSGIHRSLGSHVSKVRSVELDDWTDEQISAMETVGNARSNAFFEAELPAGSIEALTDATIGNFVRQKYLEKRWVSPATPTPPITSLPTLPDRS